MNKSWHLGKEWVTISETKEDHKRRIEDAMRVFFENGGEIQHIPYVCPWWDNMVLHTLAMAGIQQIRRKIKESLEKDDFS
jgi:hypothetical protein